MNEFVHSNEAVAKSLNENYIIMKVSYGDGNDNEEFLGNYPPIPAYPYFLVLDSDGTFLHQQRTGELEQGRGYNEKVFLAFLDKWKP